MALVIPPGFAECAIEFKHNSDPQPWYVTFGVDTSSFEDGFPIMANAIGARWMTTIGIFLSHDVRNTGVRLTIGQDGPDNLTIFVPREDPGPAVQDMLPQNCALLVQKQTATPGRKGKGRFYIPGVLQENKVNAVGGLDGTFLSDMQAQLTAFLDVMNTGDGDFGGPIPLVLLHNNYGAATPLPSSILALVGQSTIATQRRRLRS